MTTVADALFQWGGVPVGVNPTYNKIMANFTASYKKGRSWFVDPSYGGNGNGKSPAKAFSTMDAAFDSLQSGDIIYFCGKVVEQLVTPVQVFDVTVIGCGNRPRHADSTPTGGGYAAAQWAPPASGGVAAQATVQVLQQGWRFTNILFTAVDANAACIELVRDAASGNSERDASHADIVSCRFSGAGVGIRSGVAALYTEIVNNARVVDCDFMDMTFAMRSAIQASAWQIKGNRFRANTNHITVQAGGFQITDNIFGSFTAASSSGGIDLRSGAGLNIITKNYLSGTYSNAGGYQVANANDEWAGNFNTLAGALTVSDPA